MAFSDMDPNRPDMRAFWGIMWRLCVVVTGVTVLLYLGVR